MMDRFNVWATMLVGRTQELKSERGQTFAEYALILAVVVLVAVVGFGAMGTAISAKAQSIVTAL